jgi:4-hydroxy-4-methyl-2-oxoglutarate aldolase
MTGTGTPDLKALLQAGSSVVSDALGGGASLPFDIRPVTPSVAFGGPALTVRLDLGDNRGAYEALSVMRPGDVLVIDCAGVLDVAVVGGTLAGHCRNLSAAAIVTNGLVRDRAALERLGLPVWARGMCPAAPRKLTPGAVGAPVDLGVTIRSGDLLVGDVDGITVVPANPPADFADRFARACEREKRLDSAVAAGDAEPAWLLELRRADRTARRPRKRR